MARPPRYSPEFRADAVALVLNSTPPRSIAEVALDLGANRETLRCWVRPSRPSGATWRLAGCPGPSAGSWRRLGGFGDAAWVAGRPIRSESGPNTLCAPRGAVPATQNRGGPRTM